MRAAIEATDELPRDEFHRRLLETLPQLKRFARSYCGSRADADDAVQVTCERALERWQQWNGQGAFDHWLVKILINSWRDEQRSRKIRAGPALESVPERVDDTENQADRLYLEQVNEEIVKLPEAQREVLLLVASEGFSYQETASTLGIPIGTVMSRLCRARQTLIAKLGYGTT
ncbi:MAG TPA: RNA polymerase sigma factor [Gammaproteobacteria bacterium]